MPDFRTPGLYVEETPTATRHTPPAATSEVLILDLDADGDAPRVAAIDGHASYQAHFGDPAARFAGRAAMHFFANGGRHAKMAALPPDGADAVARIGIAFAPGGVLDGTGFTLLCAPGLDDIAALQCLQAACAQRQAFLIVDAPAQATDAEAITHAIALSGDDAAYAALYHPWLCDAYGPCPPSGAVAGIYARTDVERGVWKAPAGTGADLRGMAGVQRMLDDRENETLNPHAVNAIRRMPRGLYVWGARTLAGQDTRSSPFKYVPVRRLASFLHASLAPALAWTALEPNAPRLWSRVAVQAGAFLDMLFRAGAFQGATPERAYYVRCGSETADAGAIAHGEACLELGFAALRPAEFVVLRLPLRTAGAA